MKRFLLILFFCLWAPAWAQPGEDAVQKKALELYRWFHANPEVSLKEAETSGRLAEELRSLGLEVTTGIGGYGLMAVLKGKPGGPVVLYRADMDALPIAEQTGLPYASTNPGVMHACGHDIHMSVAWATLATLARSRNEWSGTVVFIGQPAEEIGRGATAMLADPKFHEVLKGVAGEPVVALALHDYALVKAGQAVLTPGFVTANVDSVDITVRGLGGHGAAPETTVDPVVIGSEIVMALQTIVSRKLAPGTRAVVTVGSFQAGTKRNIIPPTAELQLTVRSYEEETRRRLIDEIRRISVNIAAAHSAPQPPVVNHHDKTYTPAGYNDPEWVKRLRPIFLRDLGEENLLEMPPSMVGEDFSEFARALEIPGVMFLLGAGAGGENPPGLHSDKFAPVADVALRVGTRLMVDSLRAALSYPPG